MAYTEALRNVYIIGVPCAILGFFGALAIKNSKMQTKAEEEESNRLARERVAAAKDGERTEREEEIAVGTAVVGAEPEAVVEQDMKAQQATATAEK